MNKYSFNKLLLAICIIVIGVFITPVSAYCKNVVVVIDPGHGGEAMGGNIDDRIERDINLKTGLAMKERLEQYDNVEVYITRDNNTDKEMTRKERFDFAKSKNADFLFSVHYNMSENHTLFGSEVWVASKGTNYVKGYQFASIEMNALTNEGLFDRGIKNKLDKDKSGEYYGILKYAEEYNIPAVIIEHCHLDEERDSAFWNDEGYKRLGEIDADSVAKYFKLSSSQLGVDYSGYENLDVEAPNKRLDVDSTEPEVCEISLDSIDDENAYITLKSYDNDTYVQYYQLSFDNGNSFNRLEAWDDRNSELQKITVQRIEKDIKLLVRTYNQYEYFLDSNTIDIPALVVREEPAKQIDEEVDDIEIVLDYHEKETSVNPLIILLVTFVSLFGLFNILFFVRILYKKK